VSLELRLHVSERSAMAIDFGWVMMTLVRSPICHVAHVAHGTRDFGSSRRRILVGAAIRQPGSVASHRDQRHRMCRASDEAIGRVMIAAMSGHEVTHGIATVSPEDTVESDGHGNG
jgi:hypothetical protein